MTIPQSDTGYYILANDEWAPAWFAYEDEDGNWLHDSFLLSFAGAWWDITKTDAYTLRPNYSVIPGVLANSEWIAND